jgi:hypothetical protein
MSPSAPAKDKVLSLIRIHSDIPASRFGGFGVRSRSVSEPKLARHGVAHVEEGLALFVGLFAGDKAQAVRHHAEHGHVFSGMPAAESSTTLARIKGIRRLVGGLKRTMSMVSPDWSMGPLVSGVVG